MGITLGNCLFGTVKLTKNADIDKYKYSGYGVRFNSKGPFSHTRGGYGKNIIIFGPDLSSPTHTNNKKGGLLAFGRDFIQGKDGTIIYVGKIYSANFTVANKKFCLRLY